MRKKAPQRKKHRRKGREKGVGVRSLSIIFEKRTNRIQTRRGWIRLTVMKNDEVKSKEKKNGKEREKRRKLFIKETQKHNQGREEGEPDGIIAVGDRSFWIGPNTMQNWGRGMGAETDILEKEGGKGWY